MARYRVHMAGSRYLVPGPYGRVQVPGTRVHMASTAEVSARACTRPTRRRCQSTQGPVSKVPGGVVLGCQRRSSKVPGGVVLGCYMTLYGYIWPCTVLYGPVRLYMALYGVLEPIVIKESGLRH